MRRLLPCLLIACNAPTADLCDADAQLQLVVSDNPRFSVEFAGGHTFVSFAGDWVNDLDHAFYVGEACGVGAELVDHGVSMWPVRLHPQEPDADDPRLVCDRFSDFFFRLDLDGGRPPELVLPRFGCNHLVVTPHGPVVVDSDAFTLWHLPNFPDEAGATEIGRRTDYVAPVWLGDRLLYVASDGVRSRDLVTGDERLLIADAVAFEHSETHLLWRARVDGAIAPMNIRDLAAGTDRYVGLYHHDEDDAVFHEDGPGWRFDADGAHVLHLPHKPGALMSAYRLDGTEVPFVAAGERLAFPPGGGVIVQDGARLVHATAGSAEGSVLDVPDGASLDDLQVFADHLEVRVERDLYAVPLDGGPATKIADGVGADRIRIDDDLLVTREARLLIVIHRPSGKRGVIGYSAEQFEYHPGRGLYYSRLGRPESPNNGVWLASDTQIQRALFTTCGGTC